MIGSIIGSNTVLCKYGICSFTTGVFGISRRHLLTRKPRPINVKSLKMKADVENFYERDDNSRIKADKQATITRNGSKKQIRLLMDDIKNLHSKYTSEDNNISYSLFCRLRPFWVVKPTEKDRSTCLCKIHDNLRLKLNTAFSGHMYATKDLNAVAKKVVCDDENKECMYRECNECIDKKVPYNNVNKEEQLTWYTWKNKRVEKNVKNKPKIVTITCKEKDQGTREVLSEDINKEISRACRHLYNIKHQYKMITLLRQHLTNNDIVIHIDFSENYVCKYSVEIQSVHFGASKRQISLHTGVAYVNEDVIPFCSVSDAFYHGPAAIWAHLDPVLKYITSEKHYNSVHFISDGPTTQYRNKQNFYLCGHMIAEYGFTSSTWNFMEAGHGKGAADGIGAAVKRSADAEVLLRKHDINCAKDFVERHAATASKVQMFLVEEAQITEMQQQLPSKLQPVPNTMKIHQYPDKLLCDCYSPVTVELAKKTDANVPGTKDLSGKEDLSENNTTVDGGAPSVQDDANVLGTGQLSEDGKPVIPAPTAGEATTSVQVQPDGLCPVGVVDETIINRYCVVEYDNRPYPGIILDVDENDLHVTVMHSVGRNKFFWPLVEDTCWYVLENVITLLRTPPEAITKRNRNQKIEDTVWEAIERKYF